LSLEGMEQVEAACQFLAEQGILPSIVRYSLAASAMDTANIIGRELKVGRDRLVPEFTYMDPRAVGKWDMLTLSSTEAAVWAMDAAEAGAEGRVCTTDLLHVQPTTFLYRLMFHSCSIGSTTTASRRWHAS
jgi:broad specificity phosphatase PhoE